MSHFKASMILLEALMTLSKVSMFQFIAVKIQFNAPLKLSNPSMFKLNASLSLSNASKFLSNVLLPKIKDLMIQLGESTMQING